MKRMEGVRPAQSGRTRAAGSVGAAFLIALFGAGSVLAAGTPSGTSVSNHATVDYQVSGISQTPVNSDTATFVVDNRIDLAVSTLDGSPVLVIPGSVDRVLTYRVTNEGNSTQDFSLAATNSATPAFAEPSEDFDASNVRVRVDVNGNGTYESGTDTRTWVDELQADSSRVVFVISDIPLAPGNDDVASYDVTAQVAVGGGVGAQGGNILTDDSGVADDPALVQTVFADGAGTTDAVLDGRHSSKDAYKIQSADLAVNKAANVSSDPINGATDPKAIPGATVDYAITVNNNGSVSAANVVIVDAIPSNTSFVVGSTGTTPGGTTIEYSNNGGATWVYAPVAGPDGSDPAVTHVRVTFPTIGNGSSGEADFQVLIL